MAWSDDTEGSLARVLGESVPPTLYIAKKSGGFGLVNNRADFSAEKPSVNSRIGFNPRQVSQGHANAHGRGVGQSNSLVSGGSVRNLIFPGASLSINQAADAPRTRKQDDVDPFDHAGNTNRMSENNRKSTLNKPGMLELEPKQSHSNFGKLEATKAQNNANNNARINQQKAEVLGNEHLRFLASQKESSPSATGNDDLAYIGATTRRTQPAEGHNNQHNISNSTMKTYGSSSVAAVRRHSLPLPDEAAVHQQAVSEFGLRNTSSRNSSNVMNYTTASYFVANGYSGGYNGATGTGTGNCASKSFVSPLNTQALIGKRNTRRSSAGGSGNKGVSEVIELLDSDDEGVQCVGASSGAGISGVNPHAKMDSDILQLYGALPTYTEKEKRLIFGNTQDRIIVERIYLGVYGFECEYPRKLYMRVDSNVNQCILLGINEDAFTQTKSGNKDGAGTETGLEPQTEPGAEEQLVQIEEIPFDQIKKIFCGRCNKAEHGHEAFVALSVTTTLVLNNVGVGPNCMLCPTLTKSTAESCKFILIMCSNKALETFKAHVGKLPMAQKKGAFLTVLDTVVKYNNETYLLAHATRDFHTRAELQRRAAEEREKKAKAERRRNRNNNKHLADIADPNDCLTYTVYPIEPEVLDAITIFNGDLKRLAPGEYLNDNLIDLKIKHLFRNMSDADRARVHCFNCMFYTRLTAERGHEAGHALVSRWTKNVDIFSKDFVLIPINYSYHWSLAVIVRPGALLADLECLQENLSDLSSIAVPASQEGSAIKRGAGQPKSSGGVSGVSTPIDVHVLDLTLTQSSSSVGDVTATQGTVAAASPATRKAPRYCEAPTGSATAVGGTSSSGRKSLRGQSGSGSDDAQFEDNNITGTSGAKTRKASSGGKVESPPLVLSSGDNTATNSDGKQGGDLKALVEEMDVDADAPAQPAGAAELAAAATERLNYINGGGDSAMKTDGDRSVDAPLDKACILHMDSLGMHSAQNIAKWLRSYLRLEWEARKRADLNAQLETKLTTMFDASVTATTTNPDSAAAGPDANGGVKVPVSPAEVAAMSQVEKIRKQVDLCRKKTFDGIHLIKCKVPMQANGHDCGLFVARYAEMILRRLPSSSAHILQNRFLTELPSNEFSQADVDKERDNMRKLIDDLKSQWEALRREQKEETAGDSDNAGDNNNGDAAAAGAPAGDHTEGGAAVGTSGVVGSSSSAVAPMFDTGTATAEDDSSDGEDTGSIAEGLVHRSAVASSAAVTPSVRHAAASSSKFAPLQQSAEQMEQERPADTDYDAIFENSSAPIPTQQSSASASQDMEYVTAASSCSADSESSCAADAIVVGHATSTSTKDKKRKATAASAVTEQDRQSKRHQRENRQEHKSTDGRHDGDCERDVLMDVPLSEDELQQAPAGHIDAADVEMETELPRSRHAKAKPWNQDRSPLVERDPFSSHSNSDASDDDGDNGGNEVPANSPQQLRRAGHFDSLTSSSPAAGVVVTAPLKTNADGKVSSSAPMNSNKAAVLGGRLTTSQAGEEEDLGEPMNDAASVGPHPGGAGLDQSGGASVAPSHVSRHRQIKRNVKMVSSTGVSIDVVSSEIVSGVGGGPHNSDNGKKKVKV